MRKTRSFSLAHKIHFHKTHFDQSRWWVRTELKLPEKGNSVISDFVCESEKCSSIERIETRKLSKYWHWEVSFKLLSNFGCDFQKCSRGRIVWNCKKGWEVSFQLLSGFGCDFQKCSLTSLSLGATIHSFISDLSHSYLLLIVFFTFRIFNFSTR